MKQEELIRGIKELRAITPRADFAGVSKLAILGNKTAQKPEVLSFPLNILSQTLNAGFSMVLTALFLIIVLGSISGSLKGALLSALLGVDGSVLSEASAVSKDIDIHLDEAKYSAALATRAKSALKEASTNSPGHLNPAILEKEANDLRAYGDASQNLDELLDKAAE